MPVMTVIQLYPLDVIYKAKKERSAVFVYGRTDRGRLICLMDRDYLASFSVRPVSGISAEQLKRSIEKEIVETGRDEGAIKEISVETKKSPFRQDSEEVVQIKCSAEEMFRAMDAVSSLAEASDFYETDIPVARRYLIDKRIVPVALSEAEGEFINYPGKVSVMKVSSFGPVSNESIPEPRILALSVLRAVDVTTVEEAGGRPQSMDDVLPEEDAGRRSDSIASVALFMVQSIEESGESRPVGEGGNPGALRVFANASLCSANAPVESGSKGALVVCSSDSEILEKLQKEIEMLAPDFIAGFGSDANDLMFLAERAEELGIAFSPALDSSRVRTRRKPRRQARIVGMPHLDLSGGLYRRIASSVAQMKVVDFDSADYSIGTLAELTLNEGERKALSDTVEGHRELSFLEMWRALSREGASYLSVPESVEPFLRAVRENGVNACLVGGVALKLMPYLLELCKITGVEPFSASRLGPGSLVEWHLIRHSVEKGFVVPKKPPLSEVQARKQQTFTGGFVLEPKKGIHRDVSVCDFRGLYPSIIVHHNISPDTLKCDCCRDSAEKIILENKQEVWFCQKRKGFFPELLEELISRRDRINSILKMNRESDSAGMSSLLKARSDMLKLISNSFYGYLGFPNSRWYSFESVRAVAALGRRYIE
ncbi:hypothetical protein D6764_05850, partial [Candidatus Woesearchaeota archaeon]